MRKCTPCKNQGPDFLIDGLFFILKGAWEASLGRHTSTDKSDMDTNESLGESVITGELIPPRKWAVLFLCTECATSKSTVLSSDVYFWRSTASSKMIAVTRQNVFPLPYTIMNSLDHEKVHPMQKPGTRFSHRWPTFNTKRRLGGIFGSTYLNG